MSDIDTSTIGIGFKVPTAWFAALKEAADAEFCSISAVLRRAVAADLKARGYLSDD
jgi:hypothetical protein